MYGQENAHRINVCDLEESLDIQHEMNFSVWKTSMLNSSEG